jgi:hypothetical protein
LGAGPGGWTLFADDVHDCRQGRFAAPYLSGHVICSQLRDGMGEGVLGKARGERPQERRGGKE